MKKIIHVTHNDGDALGCALVVGLIPDFDTEVAFIQAGETDQFINSNILNDENYLKTLDGILITDLSITHELAAILQRLLDEGVISYLNLFDHHITNNLDELGYSWIHVGKNKYESAALQVFNYYKNTFEDTISKTFFKQFQDFIKSISRYDTWQWREQPEYNDGTEQYANGLIRMLGIIDVYERIVLNMKKSILFSDEDKALIKYYFYAQKKAVSSFRYSLSNFNEYRVAILLSSKDDMFSNAILEKMYQSIGEVDLVVAIKPDLFTLEFRTNKPDVNVGRIAKNLYQGGGHKKASGCHMNYSTFNEWMTRYYNGQMCEYRE